MKKIDYIKKKYRSSFSIRRINNKNLDDENLNSISVRFFMSLVNNTFLHAFQDFRVYVTNWTYTCLISYNIIKLPFHQLITTTQSSKIYCNHFRDEKQRFCKYRIKIWRRDFVECRFLLHLRQVSNPVCKKMAVNTWTGLVFIALSQQPFIHATDDCRYHVIFFFLAACRANTQIKPKLRILARLDGPKIWMDGKFRDFSEQIPSKKFFSSCRNFFFSVI